ncbi:MAG: hypothetical protein GYB64_11645, partial [Chloroflexi bacterium]|nr:hypothetical protein [Chloroflexota bacterium]
TPTPTITPSPTITPTGTLPPTSTTVPSQTPGPTAVPPNRASIDTGGYATPSTPPSTAIPTPVDPVAQPQGVRNILLLGSDQRPNDSGILTDTVIIVSINQQENTANMLSIPRDILVYAPGWTMVKINQVYNHGEAVGWPGGGFGLLKETLLYNFGIPIDHYAMVDLRGFQDIVDVLGGVEVPVDCAISGVALTEPRLTPEDFDTYEDWVDYTDPEVNPDNYTDFTIPVGMITLDGYEALWYARQRKGSSDFDRAYRQQQVLRAIFRQARDIGITDITNLPGYYREYNDLITTDMGLGNFLELAPIAANMDLFAINSYILTPDNLTAWNDPDLGQIAYLPNPEDVQFLVSRAMLPPAKNYVTQNTATVEIRNGTGRNRIDEVAADLLINQGGLDTTPTGFADSTGYGETVIYDYTGRDKTSQLLTLQRLLRVGDDNVIEQPDPNRVFDYMVIIGADYTTCRRNVDVPAPYNPPTATPTEETP